MFWEAEWGEFHHAGSEGNRSPAPLGGKISNSVKTPWIHAAKLVGFLQWGGPRQYAKFGWLVWSGGLVVVGEGFGCHGWVGLVVCVGVGFFCGCCV